mmetsp:Transcript_38226/g.110397  ORF Transcript_38226/g.110397 Transcript_38226/m.110397 type:complete len:535 (+) Transcript_38226:65-1669(+)
MCFSGMKAPPVWLPLPHVALLTSYVGCIAAHSVPLSAVAERQHLDSYEAAGSIQHVAGSACCLDVNVKATGHEVCRRSCMERETCSAFAFLPDPDESQCVLTSQKESNFLPVDSPRGCEHRCVDRADCEAFVFSPSTRLCFLIRFLAGANASLQPAQDRVFGLVRRPAGVDHIVLKPGCLWRQAISQALDMSLPYIPSSAALVISAMSVALLYLSGRSAVTTLHQRSLLRSTPVGTSVVALGSNSVVPALDSNAGLPPCNLMPQSSQAAGEPTAQAVRLYPCEEEPVISTQLQQSAFLSSAASGAVKVHSCESEPMVSSPSLQHSAHLSSAASSTVPRRVSAPAKDTRKAVARNVDWAGPTNYPVAGEVSPSARGAPREVLLQESQGETLDDCTNIRDGGTSCHESTSMTSYLLNVRCPTLALILGSLIIGVWCDRGGAGFIVSVALTILLFGPPEVLPRRALGRWWGHSCGRDESDSSTETLPDRIDDKQLRQLAGGNVKSEDCGHSAELDRGCTPTCAPELTHGFNLRRSGG